MWKDSLIVPVPKVIAPKSLKEFRPAALTFFVMKTLEKPVKNEILSLSLDKVDLLQFAYKPGRGL